MKQWADDPDRPWTKLKFNQFGLHATLEVKTIQALYYKAGKDRLLTIVLSATWKGNAPIRCSIVPSLIGHRGKSSRPTLAAGPLNAPLKLQAVLGLGGPCQSSSQGRRADRADGVVHLQSGGRLVSQVGTSVATFSLPTLVPEEGRAIVCRHVDDPEAGQLRGKNATTASKTVWLENLDRPAHRASQPNRVSDTSAGDPGLQHLSTIDSPGGISPAGPLANRLGICET